MSIATASSVHSDSQSWGKGNTPEKSWRGFSPGAWVKNIDVRDFIQRNYTAYLGDSTFLSGPDKSTLAIWEKIRELSKAERATGTG